MSEALPAHAAPPGDGAAPWFGRWLILSGVWLIYFSFGVIVASMAPLIGPIGAELGLSNFAMGAILGAWPFAYILAAVPAGILLDRIGARKMLLIAALIMAASAFARSMAETPMQMLGAVALFGFGGPLISIGAPKVIARLFDGPTRATAMGLYVTGPYLGGLVALAATNSVLMPLMGDDWRRVMIFHAGLVAVAGLAWFVLSRAPADPVEGSDDGGKRFSLTAFGDLLRIPVMRLILAMSIGVFFINHAMNNWLPELLISKGMTPTVAGYWASIPALVGIAGALIVPRFATPTYRLAVLAALFASTLAASLLLQATQGAALFAGLILQGVARGSMMTVAILLLMETPSVPKDRIGMAGGLFFTAAEIGGVLGPITFGLLSDLGGSFAWPLASLTVISLCLLFVLARLKSLTGGVIA